MRKRKVVAITASTAALLLAVAGSALAHGSTNPGPHRGGGADVEITDNSDNSINTDNDLVDVDIQDTLHHIISDNNVQVLTSE